MIPDHFTVQFGRNFTAAVQQTQSRFRKAAVVETGCTGEAKTHNLVLPIHDSETTGERLAHPLVAILPLVLVHTVIGGSGSEMSSIAIVTFMPGWSFVKRGSEFSGWAIA